MRTLIEYINYRDLYPEAAWVVSVIESVDSLSQYATTLKLIENFNRKHLPAFAPTELITILASINLVFKESLENTLEEIGKDTVI